MSDLESVVKKLEKLAGKETVAPESVHRNGPMKLKAWKVITGDAPVAPHFYDDDPGALSVACKEWLLETHEDHEVTARKANANPKKFEKNLSNEHEQWRES
jgi:hypothetical protein